MLDVAVTPSRVVLRPGGEVKLEVTVKRRPGYDKGATLDVLGVYQSDGKSIGWDKNGKSIGVVAPPK